MKTISKQIKNSILFLKVDKNLFDITLDEKLQLARENNGTWYGGTYQNKISTLMFKLNK